MLLDGIWKLSCPARNLSDLPITIPGDVHTALINAKLIPDPYYSTNESLIQWVSDVEWIIERTFSINNLSSFSAYLISLEQVDAISTIFINQKEIITTTSAFIFYRIDIHKYLHDGENTIKILFKVAKKVASERFFSTLPISYPYSENNKVPFMNYLRLPQFHSGWDWGPCIISSGILRSIKLIPIFKDYYDLIEVSTEQLYKDDKIDLKVDIDYQCFENINRKINLSIQFAQNIQEISIGPHEKGKYRYTTILSTDGLERWNTFDFGKQPLYDLIIKIGNHEIKKRIGIRKLIIDTHDDDYGTTFQFLLNDHVVNAKGANFIPIDSIPSLMTYEKTYELIQDMISCNMNIIRIWGGGYYPDFLLDICDELGVLVWQDLMFGCAQYPNTEYFHKEIEEEFTCQILRMKHHASICIYCGDNEDFQAINWFHFDPKYKAWLRQEYAVFNQFVKGIIEKLDPSRRFWPSSPSDGTFDYDGVWVTPKKGDMHYWEVWHGGQPFESFYTIKPRFCSEFGYQSYPSLPTVNTFASQSERNIFSDAFDNHQKNAKGNELIKNMFKNYFKEPADFIQQLYLSQVQQSIAIRLGCEYFRTLKPYTRGMIYWQINDCWPVTSWSSIEYGGRWKQLQYHARRFFDPLMPTFFENKDYDRIIKNGHETESKNTTISLFVVNDRLEPASYSIDVNWIDFDGNIIKSWNAINHVSNSDTADVVWRIPSAEVEGKRNIGFFRCILSEDKTGRKISNFYFATEYKNCDLKKANITANLSNDGKRTTIRLNTDKPAFFVHLESEKVRKFSDSSLLLVPGEEICVTCDEVLTSNDLTIYQLSCIGQ